MTDMPNQDFRYEAIQSRLTAVERQQAVTEVTIRTIADDVSVIKANTSRIVWVVLLSIIGAAISFILRGGLNVPLV